MLDQHLATLDAFVNEGDRFLVRAETDTEALRRHQDLSGAKVDAGLAKGVVQYQQVVGRYATVVEGDLAVIHESTTDGLVAARDLEAGRVAGHEEARRSLLHPSGVVGVGVHDV